MDWWLTLIVLTVLVISGVWGSIILSGLFKRLGQKQPVDELRFEELREEQGQLEARLEQLEDEIGFFRELHRTETPTQLPGPEEGDR